MDTENWVFCSKTCQPFVISGWESIMFCVCFSLVFFKLPWPSFSLFDSDMHIVYYTDKIIETTTTKAHGFDHLPRVMNKWSMKDKLYCLLSLHERVVYFLFFLPNRQICTHNSLQNSFSSCPVITEPQPQPLVFFWSCDKTICTHNCIQNSFLFCPVITEL